MKRIAILLAVALTGVAAFADESIIIDFNTLVADFPKDAAKNNSATILDFSAAAGQSFTDADKALMKTSLFTENWDVELNSSAKSVNNMRDSFVKQAELTKDTPKFKAGTKVLGVRIHFPIEDWNSVAMIRPPFEVPAYMDKDAIGADGKITVDPKDKSKGTKFDGYGVVKNVGVIKSISANVRGLNFPHKITVVLKDQNGIESEYLLGSNLLFDGWRSVTWDNPNYVNDVRDRELKVFPLYPNSAPYVKIAYFKIYKDASMVGGDFVGYIKDLSVIYDKAVINFDRDIDDEAVWSILQDKEQSRRDAEQKRLGGLQVLRFLEDKKINSGTTAPAATTTK